MAWWSSVCEFFQFAQHYEINFRNEITIHVIPLSLSGQIDCEICSHYNYNLLND
jgi:hypothetical protein